MHNSWRGLKIVIFSHFDFTVLEILACLLSKSASLSICITSVAMATSTISLSFRCMLSQQTAELPVDRQLFVFSLERNDIKLVRSGVNYADWLIFYMHTKKLQIIYSNLKFVHQALIDIFLVGFYVATTNSSDTDILSTDDSFFFCKVLKKKKVSHSFCKEGCYPTINNSNPDTRSQAFCLPGFIWLGLMQGSHFVLIGQKAVTAWSPQRDTLPSQDVEPVLVSAHISQSCSQQSLYCCVDCVAYAAAKSTIYYLLLAALCFT